MAWYYYKDKQCMGPFTEDRVLGLVREGTIDETTPMRTDAMADWLPLKEAMQHFGDGGRQRVAASYVEPDRFSAPELTAVEAMMPLLLAVLRGGIAAAIMTYFWYQVGLAVGNSIPYVALVIGFGVGLAVRIGGDPYNVIYRVIACVLAAGSIAIGNAFIELNHLAASTRHTVGETYSDIGLGGTLDLVMHRTSFVDIAFYLIAVGAAYYVSSKTSWGKKKD